MRYLCFRSLLAFTDTRHLCSKKCSHPLNLYEQLKRQIESASFAMSFKNVNNRAESIITAR